MQEKNTLRNKTSFFIIGVLLIIILSAFGCKEEETPTTDSESNEQPKVTYEVPQESTDEPFVSQNGQEIQPDQPQDTPQDQTQDTTQDPSQSTDSQTQNGTTDSQQGPEDQTVLLSQTEKIVEIYGTFTNKGSEPYKNLKDLDIYATANMKGWIGSQTSKPFDQNAAFFGMTTKALSSVVLESSANNAKVLVTTKREEIVESRQQPRVFYALIEVQMVMEDDQWKVDGLYWQK